MEKASCRNSFGSDVSIRETHDRATKRKALSTIAAATHDSNDENSENEFVNSNTKKRKFQQSKKPEETQKKSLENQRTNKASSSVDSPEMIDVDDGKDSLEFEFDNSDLHTLRKTGNAKTPTNAETSEKQSSEYPRRVPPPNPNQKKFFKGPRSKYKSTPHSQNSSLKKKSIFINDEEIQKTLDAIDETIDDNDNDCVEITNEIKPAPVAKGVQRKMQMAQSHLEGVRDAEKQKVKLEEEAKKRKEREEQEEKDAMIQKRLQEEEDEKSQRMEKERKCNEQNNFYKSTVFSQPKQRVTRANYNKPRPNYGEINEVSAKFILDYSFIIFFTIFSYSLLLLM